MGIPTQINVRVIAKFGKYLGDDIGGALVTIHDVQTGELLARGNTAGSSGVKTLMGIPVTRAQVLTTEQASVFTTSLDLEAPKLIKVTAHGPLAAQQSANTVSLTQWVYPGRNVNGFLLEIPGLVVQILNPPTHFLPTSAPQDIEIRANVTMMCGCPIESAPWTPDLFEVTALIKRGEFYSLEFPLTFDQKTPDGIPSQFSVTWQVPKNETPQPEIYELTVFAFQQETGNTGVDKVTVIIPAAPQPSSNVPG